MHLQAWVESEEILYTCVLGNTNLTKSGYIHLSWLLGLPSLWVVSEVAWLLSPVLECKWACGRERGLQGSAETARWAKPAVLWPHKLVQLWGPTAPQKSFCVCLWYLRYPCAYLRSAEFLDRCLGSAWLASKLHCKCLCLPLGLTVYNNLGLQAEMSTLAKTKWALVWGEGWSHQHMQCFGEKGRLASVAVVRLRLRGWCTMHSVDGCPGWGYDHLHRNGWETNTSKEGQVWKLKENAGIKTSGRVFMLEIMQMCLMVRRISFWNSLPEAMGMAIVKMKLDKFQSRHYRLL